MAISDTLAAAPALTREQEAQKQQVWTLELKKSDERANQFKTKAEEMGHRIRSYQDEVEELKEKVANRDQEIARLHSSYQGGQTF